MIDIRCLVIDLFSPPASHPKAIEVRQHSGANCRRYPPFDEKLDRPGRLL
jgi:hypothetical protein